MAIQKGSWVRVITPDFSDYYMLEGRVVDVSQYNDAGVVEFNADMMKASLRRPDLWRKASGRVNFYWKNLQEVILE